MKIKYFNLKKGEFVPLKYMNTKVNKYISLYKLR